MAVNAPYECTLAIALVILYGYPEPFRQPGIFLLAITSRLKESTIII